MKFLLDQKELDDLSERSRDSKKYKKLKEEILESLEEFGCLKEKEGYCSNCFLKNTSDSGFLTRNCIAGKYIELPK